MYFEYLLKESRAAMNDDYRRDNQEAPVSQVVVCSVLDKYHERNIAIKVQPLRKSPLQQPTIPVIYVGSLNYILQQNLNFIALKRIQIEPPVPSFRGLL